MPFLSEAELAEVERAVAAAESRSGGEITTAIIPESDDYAFRELVFAIAVGALAWIAAIAAGEAINGVINRVWWGAEPWMLQTAQGALGILAGLVAYLSAQLPAIDRLIVPRRVMAEAVRRRAMRHFVESGTYDTVDNTGLLLFVSLLERRVELVADRGIHAVVEAGTWDAIVSALTEGIRAGRTAAALTEAVTACGDVLDGRVQRRPDDTNELPDKPDQLGRGS